jgi:antitoxin (DNA-binding transcriptional repressor) of toxin-antitoxin stability system
LAKVARGQTVRVTVRGRAVAQLVPATADADEANAARHRLHGSLVRYEEPFEPTLDLGEWEMNR